MINFRRFIPITVLFSLILIGATIPRLLNLFIELFRTLMIWVGGSYLNIIALFINILFIGYLILLGVYLAKYGVERNINEEDGKNIEREKDKHLPKS